MDRDNQEWWTSPCEGSNGGLVMVTGRGDIDKFRNNPRFSIRVTVTWRYGDTGMPDRSTANMMENVTDLLADTFDRDPVAVMTSIYTGEGVRDWVFYTLSTNIFGKKLNEALADLPLLPLEISVENDPEWEEYDEMRASSELNA